VHPHGCRRSSTLQDRHRIATADAGGTRTANGPDRVTRGAREDVHDVTVGIVDVDGPTSTPPSTGGYFASVVFRLVQRRNRCSQPRRLPRVAGWLAGMVKSQYVPVRG
jgi:hypothetical protein